MKKTVRVLLLLGFIGGFWLLFGEMVQRDFIQLRNAYLPCRWTINYSLETFDQRFKISREDFLAAVADAEAVWEEPIQRDLFAHTEEGNLKISLIYDYRQEATDKLQDIGGAVEASRDSYETMKRRLEKLEAEYEQKRIEYERAVAALKARHDAYNREVQRWNRRGGAPKDAAERLNNEREAITAEAANVETLRTALNRAADEINALVAAINRVVSALNLNVDRYNEIGRIRGDEFEEGLYQRRRGIETIDIYEFDNREELIRVLAHELGHALGLDHIDDPEAVMYRLNQGEKAVLSEGDIAALKSHCGIEK